MHKTDIFLIVIGLAILGMQGAMSSGLIKAKKQIEEIFGDFEFPSVGMFLPDISRENQERIWQEQVQPALQKIVKSPDSWWDWVQQYMPDLTRSKADEIWAEENLYAAAMMGHL